MRPSLLLPAVLAVLTLGACGKKEDTAAPGATAGTAPAASTHDMWPAVAPLLVDGATRSYTGGCTGASQPNAAISLDAEGKLTEPSGSTDMRKAQLITLTRETAGGVIKAGAMLSMEGDKGPVLSMIDDGKPEGASASVMRAEQMLHCSNGAPLDKLRSQPLYKTMARLVETPGVALKCVKTANPMEQKNAEFKLAGGVATVGGESFDLSRAKLETLMILPAENQVTYAFDMPDGPMLHVSYDTAGKLIAVHRRDGGAPTQGCQAGA